MGAPTMSCRALRSWATWASAAAASLRARAGFEAAAGEADRGFPRGQGLADHRQLVLVGGERRIGAGGLGDQADLHRAAVLLHREEGLQGRRGKAAHPSEQVELEGGQAHRGAVLLHMQGLARARDAGWRARAYALADGVDRRQQLGALDAVEGPRPLHLGHGDVQVAVLAQGQGDQGLQLGLDHHLAPRQVARRRSGGRGRRRRPGVLDRQGGALVGGGQGAAGQDGCGHEGGCDTAHQPASPEAGGSAGGFLPR
jgi:hypothetical protein